MNKFFEVKVKYQSIDESGKDKLISESYLLSAINYSDAETRAHEELSRVINGTFAIDNIKGSNLSEILREAPGNEFQSFYKCKVSFISVDEEKGYERKHTIPILVEAPNIVLVCADIDKWMKDTVSRYSIDSVTISKIVDYFELPKEESDEKEDNVETNTLN